jgi:hypothetical protein
MFGLPIETNILVFGFPIFWVIYTFVFLFISRRWPEESNDKDRS